MTTKHASKTETTTELPARVRPMALLDFGYKKIVLGIEDATKVVELLSRGELYVNSYEPRPDDPSHHHSVIRISRNELPEIELKLISGVEYVEAVLRGPKEG